MLFCGRPYRADRNQLTARGYSSTIRMYGTGGARVGRQGQPETCPCVGENRIVDCWQEAPTAGAGAKTPPTIDCRNDIALHLDFMKG
jgi:hypothetical protein